MARGEKANQRQFEETVQSHIDALVSAVTELVRQDTARRINEAFAAGRFPPLRAKRKRILPCIAPGCKNPSKGPRFHYLCDEHIDAPKKDWQAWQEAKREKAKAAG